MTNRLGTRGRDPYPAWSDCGSDSGHSLDPSIVAGGSEYGAGESENLGTGAVKTRANNSHFLKLRIQHKDDSQIATIGNRTPFIKLFGWSKLGAKLGRLFTW